MTILNNKLPPVPRLRYEEVRGNINSGDLIMCSGKSIFSQLIKRFTDSIWSHVGFILRVDAIDRIVVMESVESKGVQMVPFSHYINNYEGSGKPYAGDILIARHSDFKESSVRNISRHAIDLLGYRYDTTEIMKIASRITISEFLRDERCELPVRDNEYICSEYVYECYQSIGIHIKNNCNGFIAPADFARDENINAVCLISK